MTTTQATHPTTTATDRVTDSINALLGFYGYKRRDLAEHLHVDAGTVTRMLNGTRRMNIDTVDHIAEFLGVPVSVLFDGGDAIRERVQNWKKNNRPDLRMLEGGGPTHGGTARPNLTVVR